MSRSVSPAVICGELKSFSSAPMYVRTYLLSPVEVSSQPLARSAIASA